MITGRMMMGHGTGEIVFYLTSDGRPVGLEIVSEWIKVNGMEYTPKIPLGHEFDFV